MRSSSHSTVRRADVHVLSCNFARERTGQVGGDGLGLGDLRLQTLTLEHVLEVHVAADVQLVGAVEGTPRSSNSFAITRWVMVAPTWLLMSSPTIGTPASRNFLPTPVGGDEDGSALTKATPASMQH